MIIIKPLLNAYCSITHRIHTPRYKSIFHFDTGTTSCYWNLTNRVRRNVTRRKSLKTRFRVSEIKNHGLSISKSKICCSLRKYDEKVENNKNTKISLTIIGHDVIVIYNDSGLICPFTV